MNSGITDVLNEMIAYTKNRTPGKGLDKVYEKIGSMYVFVLVIHIISWQHTKFYDPETDNLEQSDIQSKGGELKNNFLILLESCPALNSIFQVNGDILEYRPEISDELKTEIRSYITNNYEPVIHVRRRTRK